jgi:hypothetical protein
LAISAPPQFINATQWGIGVGATPDQSAGIIVGFNYTQPGNYAGQAFAQFYQTNASTGQWAPFGQPMLGDVLTGFDTTEMNPAGALVSKDTLTL